MDNLYFGPVGANIDDLIPLEGVYEAEISEGKVDTDLLYGYSDKPLTSLIVNNEYTAEIKGVVFTPTLTEIPTYHAICVRGKMPWDGPPKPVKKSVKWWKKPLESYRHLCKLSAWTVEYNEWVNEGKPLRDYSMYIPSATIKVSK